MKSSIKQINAAFLSFALVMQPISVYSQSGKLSVNFRDVEIRQIIESVGELTGTNFLIDRRVKGKVTIIASDPVPADSLYDIMLSILAMHDLRAVEGANGLVRIIPANISQRYTDEKVREDLMTEIITIQYLNIGSVMPIIKPLMTPAGKALAHKDTNKIIITDIRPNLMRLKSILAKVDIAAVADFEIINLEYADAVEVHKIVNKIQNKNLRHLVEIVADREANRIIMSGPDGVRRGIRTVIAELDTPASASSKSGRIVVIPLHYAKAGDMEEIIRDLFSAGSFLENLGGRGAYEVSAKPDKKTKKADKDGDDAKDEPKAMSKSTRRNTGHESKRNYTIRADEGTNVLIVGGTPKIIAAVRQVIAKLDVPRPQVLIEAIIADISAAQSAAINSHLSGRKEGVANAAGEETTIPAGAVGGLVASLTGINEAENTLQLVGNIVSGRDHKDGSPKYRLSAVIEALRTDGNTNILSTPSILTMNNEEAEINVSDTRYLLVGDTTTDGGNRSNSYEKEEFGTKLKVTPQITEGKAVRLDIEQETEDIVDDVVDGGTRTHPDTIKRVLSTSVLVNDGDILVLGGLIRSSRSETQNWVPLLSKIPILGHLFKDRGSSNRAQTLMIFIRPTILRTPDESYEFSKERYAKLRLEQIGYGENIDSFLSDKDIEGAAILPKLPESEPATNNRPRYRLRRARSQG